MYMGLPEEITLWVCLMSLEGSIQESIERTRPNGAVSLHAVVRQFGTSVGETSSESTVSREWVYSERLEGLIIFGTQWRVYEVMPFSIEMKE